MASNTFDVEAFCASPSFEKLENQNPKKDDWKAIAFHFDIPITYQMTKEVIKNTVIEQLVNQGLLEEAAAEELTPMSISLGAQNQSLVNEPLSPQLTPKDQSNNNVELEKLKLDYQLKMYQMQIEREKMLKEQELEREKMLKEQEIKFKELQIRELEVQNDSKFKEMEIDLKEKMTVFNATKVSSLVPNFDETDVDSSLKSFESVARRHHWPEDQWISLLVPKLTGKAYRVYSSLSD